METEAMDVQQQDGEQGGTPDRVVNHVHTTQPQAIRKPDVTGEKDVYEANFWAYVAFKLSLHWRKCI